MIIMKILKNSEYWEPNNTQKPRLKWREKFKIYRNALKI